MPCCSHERVTESRGHQRSAIRTHSKSTVRLSAVVSSAEDRARSIGSVERNLAGDHASPASRHARDRAYRARHRHETVVQPRAAAAPLGPRGRKKRRDHRPPAGTTVGTHAPAMGLGQVTNNGESETGTASLTRARGIDAIKSLEDPGHVL